MSLDVYLITKEPQNKKASSGIFVRENGGTKEISQEEWNAKYPDKEPVKFEQKEQETNEVFSANITHNLVPMASAAELYYPLWRPEEISITKASQLMTLLSKGLQSLLEKADYYKTFNPENGWGSYEGLLGFVENYLNACREYPDADVEYQGSLTDAIVQLSFKQLKTIKMINELAKEVHKNAKEKGFFDKEKNIGEMLCLIHSEVSEALEADRKDRNCILLNVNDIIDKPDFSDRYSAFVKGSFEEEMADIVIRVMDLCAFKNIDLEAHIKAKMKYNSLREKMHGKKY